MTGHIYIFLTLLLTTYGQLILKWRLRFYEEFPSQFKQQMLFFVKTLIDPYILSGFVAAFVASLTWIAALTRFDLSYAYPFTSLSFIVVLIVSYFLFNEPFTLNKLIGVILIMAGVYIAAK